MSIKCPECGAPSSESATYCAHCGAALGNWAKQEGKPHGRFKIVVAFLIAFVSIAGAVLAFRITIASGNAADADVAGIVSSVNRHQARIATEADLYRDLRAYLQVRIHDLLSESLIAERDGYPDDDPPRDRLWNEGWTETYVAEGYLDQIDLRPEYLHPDGSYNKQAFLDIQGAEWALRVDFNTREHFSEADRLRTKVQRLMGVALVLSVALVFYTVAEVVNHTIKYLFVVLGSLVFALAIVATLVIELAMV